ncbi:hypothetical protein STEG23_038183 [Scotinomys teguina]
MSVAGLKKQFHKASQIGSDYSSYENASSSSQLTSIVILTVEMNVENFLSFLSHLLPIYSVITLISFCRYKGLVAISYFPFIRECVHFSFTAEDVCCGRTTCDGESSLCSWNGLWHFVLASVLLN